ncbi:MAG: hypothetical protein CMM99_03315 [Rickettsiales bacterium]|nr:hypothetical protein [Rickettsiales bacterium]
MKIFISSNFLLWLNVLFGSNESKLNIGQNSEDKDFSLVIIKLLFFLRIVFISTKSIFFSETLNFKFSTFT